MLPLLKRRLLFNKSIDNEKKMEFFMNVTVANSFSILNMIFLRFFETDNLYESEGQKIF